MRRTLEHIALPAFLTVPPATLAGVMGYHAILAPYRLADLLVRSADFRGPFTNAEMPSFFTGVAVILGACAGLMALAAVAGLFRCKPSLRFLRKGYGVAYLALLVYVYAVFKVTAVAADHKLNIGMFLDVWEARWHYLWPALGWLAILAYLHVVSWRAATLNLYARRDVETWAMGDRILENVRTHGRDPRYRKSWLTSVATHLAVIAGPILLQLWGCVDPYYVPHGSGTPSVAKVAFVKPREKKPKKFVLNPNAMIYFHVPDLDESEISREIDEDTQLVYNADVNAVHGAMGAGGGKSGGWPEGVGRHPIRFIRLQYNGPDWDDGMDAYSRADLNFLEELQRMSGLRTAKTSEAHPIHYLDKYPKGFAPPFVYMTGSGRISVSSRELRSLRDYCLDGGMLFADAGTQSWDRSFRSFVRALFPDKRLLVIADDDPIFQQPYQFPDGAPPLWHHGGRRALGIKHQGRWCVFYHPGDINDAWKTGHSGMDPRLAKGAFHMGINIVHYAFTQYLEETKQYRR